MRILGSLKKSFLKIGRWAVPTALVVALWGSSANAANLPSSAKAEAAQLKRPEKRLVLKMASSAQLNTSDKAMDLGHYSHSSHVSHASHVSHYSHYSG